jgi:hypothetical protein
MLNILIQYPEYLLNAIYDVPLPHSKWDQAAPDTFSVRMSSIWELLETVFSVETSQLEHVCLNEDNIALLGSVRHSGMMTRRLLTAASALIDRGYYARYDSARVAVTTFGPKLSSLSAKVITSEQKITQTLIERNFVPTSPVRIKTAEKTVGERNEVRLIVPSKIGPSLKNRVGIEVELDGVMDANPLVLYWRGQVDGERYDELAELKRSADEPVYRGEFAISDVRSTHTFPTSKVTVFSASNPIVVTEISSPH